MSTSVAFIGLGNMGAPMAENLLKAGFEVKAHDISLNAITKLANKGALPCPELSDLEGADIYITMLQNGAQVKQVCIKDKNALMKHANAGAIFIDCSSIDVDSSRELHAYAKSKGLFSLDAPVSGGIKGAQSGELTIMIGGEASTLEKAKPILEVVGGKLIHTGIEGTGQAAKICNNMILGISMVAISEAYSLADKLGLSQQKLFEVSSNASGQCWAMTKYSPVPGLVPGSPSDNAFQAGFSAQMMLKDLLLSQAAAESTAQKTDLGKAATILYQYFVDQGYGDLDFSGIIKMIEKS